MFVWVIIAIAAVIIDAFTGAFLFSWFAVGAVGAMIVNGMGLSIGVQILVFAIVSAILVIICYPIVKKKFRDKVKNIPTMEETYIGKTYVATDDIEKEGRIKVSGIYWAGINEGIAIKKGEKFIVTGIEGSKLKIKRKMEEN